MFSNHPIKSYPWGFDDITAVNHISNNFALFKWTTFRPPPCKRIDWLQRSWVAFQRRGWALEHAAFTMFWVSLISLYSKQTDKPLAADSQSVGQKLDTSACEGSKHTHTHTHTQHWMCRRPLPVFIFTSSMKKSDTTVLLLRQNDYSLTKLKRATTVKFPVYCFVASWRRSNLL